MQGKVPDEIATLGVTWNHLSPLQKALLEHLGKRTMIKAQAKKRTIQKSLHKEPEKYVYHPKEKNHPAVLHYSIYQYVSVRRQQFENQKTLWELPEAQTVRREMKPFKIHYLPGISEKAVKEVAPRRYRTHPKKRHRTVSVGDGTRVSRIAELVHHAGMRAVIVGEMGHPDISKRKEGGFPVPQKAEALSYYVQSLRKRGLLAHEVYTEIFVCVTARLPLLVCMVWLESNIGFTGLLMVKMWLHFVVLWHQNDIILLIPSAGSLMHVGLVCRVGNTL